MTEMKSDIQDSDVMFASKLSDYHFEFQTDQGAASVYVNGKLVDSVEVGACASISAFEDRNETLGGSDFKNDGFDAFDIGSFDTMPDYDSDRPDEYDFIADHTLAAFQAQKCEKVQKDTADKDNKTQDVIAAELPEHIEDVLVSDA